MRICERCYNTKMDGSVHGPVNQSRFMVELHSFSDSGSESQRGMSKKAMELLRGKRFDLCESCVEDLHVWLTRPSST